MIHDHVVDGVDGKKTCKDLFLTIYVLFTYGILLTIWSLEGFSSMNYSMWTSVSNHESLKVYLHWCNKLPSKLSGQKGALHPIKTWNKEEEKMLEFFFYTSNWQIYMKVIVLNIQQESGILIWLNHFHHRTKKNITLLTYILDRQLWLGPWFKFNQESHPAENNFIRQILWHLFYN